MICHIRAIPSCPGYFVSDTGRVWGPRKELKLQNDADGYLRFTGPGPRSQPKVLVHHAVAEAFLGPKPSSGWVCHRDDARTDNRVANLYYGNAHTNNLDTFRNGGRSQAGEAHAHAKLTWNQVTAIRQQHKSGAATRRELARQYHVHERTIGRILQNLRWVI